MKYITFFLFLLLLVGCTPKEEPLTLRDLIDDIPIPTQTDVDLVLPTSYILNEKNISATWTSSNPDVISNDGKITRLIENQEVTLTIHLVSDNDDLYETFLVTVLGIGEETFINNALNTISIPLETKNNINLVDRIYFEHKNINITWKSSNSNVLSDDGKVGLITADSAVTLSVTATYNNTEVKRDFDITVIALSKAEQVEYIFNKIDMDMPTTISQSLNLPTIFPFGLTGTWTSDTPEVISSTGEIISETIRETINLTLTLNTNETRAYTMDVINTNHMIIDREFTGTKENLIINNDKLELAVNATEGTYTTEIYETFPFTKLTASWAALSSELATNELFVRVRVDGVWSDYISYGQWGLGLDNESPNVDKTLIYKKDDEIFVSSSKEANALQMKITLRRNTSEDLSPVVTLLAATLLINNYEYKIDTTNLRTDVDYDVPKLKQNAVPNIGGIICSPTSSTMLLLYKGHDFSTHTFPHEFFAGLVYEHSSKIYGNWVYNTVGMSAFGETSYVKRMYSTEELLDHLDKVGPVAASVKGTMIGEIGNTWTTNGHLIVVRGYYYEGDQLYIRANDPNMADVYEEYKIENFLSVWRNVIYVVE